MNRRTFLRHTAAGVAMSLGGAAAAGNGDRIEPTATKPSPASLPDAWREAFDSALPQHPWLLGFKGTQELALGPVDLEIEGRLPQGLGGTLYRNGPAHHEVYGLRYHHWFDGDGMVQAFRFKDGTLSHRGRLVATQKFLAEQFEGRALYPTFGTNPPNPRPITSPDALNVANISVLPHTASCSPCGRPGHRTRSIRSRSRPAEFTASRPIREGCRSPRTLAWSPTAHCGTSVTHRHRECWCSGISMGAASWCERAPWRFRR